MNKKLRVTYNAPVILTFIFSCFLVMLAGVLTGGAVTKMLFMTYHSSLLNPLTYLRFFTHVFGHAGWAHFIGNASYILLLGPMLEEKYGSRLLIWVIGITAVVTALINYLFFWNVGLCGASGVVFAFIVLSSYTDFRDGEIPLTFILVAVVFIGQQIYEGLILSDDISNMAHVVGGLVGGVIGYLFNRRTEW